MESPAINDPSFDPNRRRAVAKQGRAGIAHGQAFDRA